MNKEQQIETLDDLLAAVQALHKELGGQTLVRKRQGPGIFVSHTHLTVCAVGKGDSKKIVSRGGIPCVLVK